MSSPMGRTTWCSKKPKPLGHLGGSVSWVSDFGSGHQPVHQFKPHVRLCADSSEPGACFRCCVSLSPCPSPAHTLSLSVSHRWINIKKIFFNYLLTIKYIHTHFIHVFQIVFEVFSLLFGSSIFKSPGIIFNTEWVWDYFCFKCGTATSPFYF